MSLRQKFSFSVFHLVSILQLLTLSEGKETQPNIVFILADDLGWADVGFTGGTDIPTPNLDALAEGGRILRNYYASPLCTPSRSEIHTGKYASKTGMNHNVIIGDSPFGLPLSEQLLPQKLQSLGYKTHLIGKWHLGHFAQEYLPTNRGFDSHFGYLLGEGGYFDHSCYERGFWGLDLRNGTEVVRDRMGQYSTELFTEEALRIIQNNNNNKNNSRQPSPFFLMLAHQAPHSGNIFSPLEVPEKYKARLSASLPLGRRTYGAMVAALDEMIGRVVLGLEEARLLDNTVIIFSSDNGGGAAGYGLSFASNWPLRGVKRSVWEGGTRVPGFIWSPFMKNLSSDFSHLFHLTDWRPTIIAAASAAQEEVEEVGEDEGEEEARDGRADEKQRGEGKVGAMNEWKKSREEGKNRQEEGKNRKGDRKEEEGDGFSHWEQLNRLETGVEDVNNGARQEILHAFDPIEKLAAIRVGDYKLVSGQSERGAWDKRFRPEEENEKGIHEYLLYSTGNLNLTAVNIKFRGYDPRKLYELFGESASSLKNISWKSIEKKVSEILNSKSRSRKKVTELKVKCQNDEDPAFRCDLRPCLFDIKQDPCEQINLADIFPDLHREMVKHLGTYEMLAKPPLNIPEDPRADPSLHRGVWGPWIKL